MHITYRGDYALKAILDLALHHASEPVTIHELAKRLDIPNKFLEQILLDLKRGGFVESRRGKVGGYLLAKPASEIKLGEVIRFIEGPIEAIACVDRGYKGCRETKCCVFRGIWQDVSKATAKIVDNINFEDLAKKNKRVDVSFTYQI